MSTYTSLHTRSFIAAVALPAYVRVQLADKINQVDIADAADEHIGVTEAPVLAGQAVSVRLKNSAGSAFFIAAEPIPSNTPVFGAADGKVAKAGDVAVGIALNDASKDGSVIEVLLT